MWIAALVAVFMAVSAAHAEQTALTIHDQNYAVVRVTRSLDLPSGISEIVLDNVPRTVLDEPFRLKGEGLTVLEQSYQYEMFGPERMHDLNLGRDIGLVLRNGDTLSGKLISSPFSGARTSTDGRFCIQTPSGRLVTKLRDSVADYVYASLPSEVVLDPRLTWKVQSAVAGARDVEMTYEAEGLSWSAHYVLDLFPDDSTAVLSGWASVKNQSGKAFEDAQVTLATGSMNRGRRLRGSRADELIVKRDVSSASRSVSSATFRVDGVDGSHIRGGQEQLMATEQMVVVPAHEQAYQLHIYRLPQRTTLPIAAVKEVCLFSPCTIRTATSYEYDASRNASQVGVYVDITNSDSAGLGVDLPAGMVSIYKALRSGESEYVGDDRIQHVPRDESVRIRIGNADGVSAVRTLLSTDSHLASRDENWELRIRNDRENDLEVKVHDRIDGKWKLMSCNRDHRLLSRSTIEIPVTVPPAQEVMVTYTVRKYKW